ncbi:DUF3618 domain-containing protein [Marinovum sp.]|uniref:DUF3618 domain-containing protein n=1 Tax=Marinovum sp. TaxID=2024839 RepID=UPI002B26F9F4|nr:DUF3618 domain-containing protein [Marinovum sp.]
MPNDTRTPDQIERDIERERAELASTVDALQDKFSPEAVITEIANGFRRHGGEFGEAVTRSAKQNPLALAVTGVGLAWLMFGRSHTDPSTEVRHSAVSHHSSNHDRRELGYAAGPTRDFASRDRYAGAGTSEREARYGTTPAAYPDWARHDLDDGVWDDDDLDADGGRSLGERASETAGTAGASMRSGASSVASGASSAAGKVGSGASSAAGKVGSGASAAGSAVAGGARSAADGVSRAARGTADRVSRARERLARGTENMSDAARERIVTARAKALDMARQADETARRNYTRGRDATAEFIEEQPLVAGAIALAVGAALAGALPRTKREDELMGQTRDELFDEAERIFHEEREKAERVAKAAMSEAESIAQEKRDAADDAAPGSKSAVEAAADEMRDAGKRVADAAKQKADEENLGTPKG